MYAYKDLTKFIQSCDAVKNSILPIGPKADGNTIRQVFGDHSFSTYAKFSEKLTFLSPDMIPYSDFQNSHQPTLCKLTEKISDCDG